MTWLRQILLRFVVVIVAAPLAYTGALFACVRFDIDHRTAPAVVTALTFTAISLAPSTKNALARAGIALAVVGIASAAALVLT